MFLSFAWGVAPPILIRRGSPILLGPPVVSFYPFFGGGFPYLDTLQKKYSYSNLSTGGPILRHTQISFLVGQFSEAGAL